MELKDKKIKKEELEKEIQKYLSDKFDLANKIEIVIDECGGRVLIKVEDIEKNITKLETLRNYCDFNVRMDVGQESLFRKCIKDIYGDMRYEILDEFDGYIYLKQSTQKDFFNDFNSLH